MNEPRGGRRAVPVRPIFDPPAVKPAPIPVPAPVSAPVSAPVVVVTAPVVAPGSRVWKFLSPGNIAISACALLILQFIIFSWSAVSKKNATYDENFHVLAAYSDFWLRDFRIDPDNFTLWKYWAALPQGRGGIRIDTADDAWKQLAQNIDENRDVWTILTLYRTPGNDADTIIARSRSMMLALSVALLIMAARWSYELGGVFASIAATALLTFDPNFLGHAALIKNDIATTLLAVSMGYAVWRAGKRATPWNLGAIVLLAGAALNVKMSAFIFGPIAIAMLLIRALAPIEWNFLNRPLRARAQRSIAVVYFAIFSALTSYLMIWTCYGFRFNGTANPAAPIQMQHLVDVQRVRHYEETKLDYPPANFPEKDWPPSATSAIGRWMEKHYLFPQAWLCGIVFASAQLHLRQMYLDGEASYFGWWYFFPVASMFKLPITILASLAFAFGTGCWRIMRARRARPTDWKIEAQSIWSCLCVVGFATILLALAMISRICLGVRHIFPTYALSYIAIGWALAWAWRNSGRIVRAIPIVLLLLLAIESISAFPDYIAFFNRVAGGARGGINLLSDANLDWGQDLKSLADWSRRHPGERIFLCYESLADPSYYNIEYTPLFSGYRLNQPIPTSGHGVLAIDANSLQGTFGTDDFRKATDMFRHSEPFEVLGGTIYLYKINLTP